MAHSTTGVQSHSSPCTGYIIFSVFNKDIDDLINHNSIKLYLKENSIPFKELEGMYKGVWELSFLVPATFNELVDYWTTKFNQECYLLLTQHKHGVRKASFVYPSKTVEVGFFMSFDDEYVQTNNIKDWTFDPSTDTYYLITPTDNVMMNSPRGGLTLTD